METNVGVNEAPVETPIAAVDTDTKPEKEDHQEGTKVVTEKAAADEYAYLQRDEFTSEIYKIELKNLGYFGIGELKKLIRKKFKLDMAKIKTPSKRDFAFVCFRSIEDRTRAIEVLNGYKWKGKELSATIAKAARDPLAKRRNEDANNAAQNGIKRPRKTTAEVTCPLAGMPYGEQLSLKEQRMREFLAMYMREAQQLNTDLHLNIDFKGLLPSPTIDGYRNKNEFTVGKNAAGEIVVGFRVGSYDGGLTEVAEVDELPHLPNAAKWSARSLQRFAREHADKFQPFNPESNSGHLRQLTVRTSNKTGELMLIVGVYSSNLSAAELAELKTLLVSYYSVEGEHKCTSLYYQDLQRRAAGQQSNPVEHLYGTEFISDSILGLDFRISPQAFFQINTSAAGVLYEQIIALAAPTAQSTMLDICCGTGTITLALARRCHQVLGVEIVPEAITDAEANARANSIENVQFFTGNADQLIKQMVRHVEYSNMPNKQIIAVVDPARSGLHTRSISAIREAEAITRLVYVSCNPNGAKRNLLDLARHSSKQYKGDPFVPKQAIAIDMFPHTDHTELVLLFERANKADKVQNGAKQSAVAEAVPVGQQDANEQDAAATDQVVSEAVIEPEPESSVLCQESA